MNTRPFLPPRRLRPLCVSQSPRLQIWRIALLLFFSSFILHPSSFAVDSPLYLPFQGQVTNQAGTIVADGQYSVIFNLYDQAVGGQPVWSERHVKIGVTRGMINVFLGSIAPLTNVDFSQTKYLGITVDTDNLATTADPEMVPRSLIIPAFHAKKAEIAQNSNLLAGYAWSSILDGVDPSTAFFRADRIAAASITNAKLAPMAVGAGNIQDQAIPLSKLASRQLFTTTTAGSPSPIGGIAKLPIFWQKNIPSNTGGFLSENVANSSIWITTSGRPVFLSLQGGWFGHDNTLSGAVAGMEIQIVRVGSPDVLVGSTQGQLRLSSGSLVTNRLPASCSFIDVPPAGQHEYRLTVLYNSNAQILFEIRDTQLAAFEL
jgi:hypothetical protein